MTDTPQREATRSTPGVPASQRKLSLGKATAFGLAGMGIGQAMSTTAAILLPYAGNGSWLAMLAATLAVMCVAISINVFARRFVGTGSLLSYLGHLPWKWPSLLVGATYIVGYIVAVGNSGAVVFTTSVFARAGFSAAGSESFQDISIVLLGIVAGYLTHRGLTASVKAVNLLGFTCLPVIAVILIANLMGDGLSVHAQMHLRDTSISQILQGAVVAIFGFIGFEGCAALAAETDQPTKNTPRILLLIVGTIGFTATVSCLIVTPLLQMETAALETGISPIAILANRAGLNFLGPVVDVLLACAMFAACLAGFNYAARIVATAAREGLLPAMLGVIDPKRRSPSNAAAAVTVLSTTLMIVLHHAGRMTVLSLWVYQGVICSYCWAISWFVTCCGAIVLVIRERAREPVSVTASILGASAILVVFVATAVQTADTLLGAAPLYVLIAAVILYVWMLRQNRLHKYLPANELPL
jgi:APA family basic amino acid/polyamine antiporter